MRIWVRAVVSQIECATIVILVVHVVVVVVVVVAQHVRRHNGNGSRIVSSGEVKCTPSRSPS